MNVSQSTNNTECLEEFASHPLLWNEQFESFNSSCMTITASCSPHSPSVHASNAPLPLPICSSSGSSSSSSIIVAVKQTRRRPAQREYDRQRRRIVRTKFQELRKLLQSAQVLTKAQGGVELPASANEKRSKYAQISTRNDLATCSTVDLLYVAQCTIARLQHMKEVMESLLLGIDCEDAEQKKISEDTAGKASEPPAEALNHDELEETSSPMSPPDTPNSLEIRAVHKRKRPENNRERCFDDIHTLLHSISVVQREYEQQVCAVTTLESQLPECLLIDCEHYLKNVGVLGFDGRMLPFTSPFQAQLDEQSAHALHTHINKFRHPHILMMHGYCCLLANGFHYAAPEQHSKDSQHQNQLSVQQLYQLFADSCSSKLFSQTSSSGLQLSSHPLCSYALPVSSFQILTQILGYLVGLGKQQYDSLIQQLAPFAVKALPKEVLECMTFPSLPSYVSKEFHLTESIKLEYEDVCAFYDLYSGRKNMMSFQKRKLTLPIDVPAIYADVDLCLIRDSNSGLPVAHMAIHRREYAAGDIGKL